MNTCLSYLSDWGKTACDFMSLVGICGQWDQGGQRDVPQELDMKCYPRILNIRNDQ